MGQLLSVPLCSEGTQIKAKREHSLNLSPSFLLGSFDTVCSLGTDASSTLGGQPACDSVPSADAAPPTRPAAEHQRTAQTTVAATQHAGVCTHELK